MNVKEWMQDFFRLPNIPITGVPTTLLRFVVRDDKRILQQLWINIGEGKYSAWKDIEMGAEGS
jgi:hypothetical protein